MKQLTVSLVCTAALIASAVPAAAQHGDQDKQVPATVSFGVGLNTAQPNNTPNHRVLPQDIHIETGSVVNFMVAGFHQIFVYKPGVTLDQIVSPATGTFVNQHVDMLYYEGILPAGGPPPGIAGDDEPVERDEPGRVGRLSRAGYVSRHLQHPRPFHGRDDRVRHRRLVSKGRSGKTRGSPLDRGGPFRVPARSYQGVVSPEPRCWASQSSLTFPTFRSVCRRRKRRRSTIANSPTEPVQNTIFRACAFT